MRHLNIFTAMLQTKQSQLLTIIFSRSVKKRFLTTRENILRLSVPDVVILVSKSEKHTDKKGGH